MDNFISIGEAADKLVTHLRAELHPPEIILFTPDATIPPRPKTPRKSTEAKTAREVGRS